MALMALLVHFYPLLKQGSSNHYSQNLLLCNSPFCHHLMGRMICIIHAFECSLHESNKVSTRVANIPRIKLYARACVCVRVRVRVCYV